MNFGTWLAENRLDHVFTHLAPADAEMNGDLLRLPTPGRHIVLTTLCQGWHGAFKLLPDALKTEKNLRAVDQEGLNGFQSLVQWDQIDDIPGELFTIENFVELPPDPVTGKSPKFTVSPFETLLIRDGLTTAFENKDFARLCRDCYESVKTKITKLPKLPHRRRNEVALAKLLLTGPTNDHRLEQINTITP